MSFRNVLLADIVRSDSPITYGVVKPGDEGNVFLVRSTDVNNNSIDLEKLRTITTEVATQYKRTELMGGELLISLVGNPGNLAIVPDSLAGANIARQVALIRLDAQKANRRFVYYYFQAGEGKEEIDKRIVGSVQSVINLKDLRTVPVKLPSLEYQKSIAHILSTLDEKIEVNNQINKTLEAMAQALFKQWFIDFEFPNENGEPYKSSGGEMVESELGLIPKGWGVGTIEKFTLEMKNGGTPNRKNSEYWNSNDIPWLKTGEICDEVVIESEEYISRKGYENSSAKVLPINSVLMAMYGATAGKIGLLKFPASTNQACCAMVCSKPSEAHFLYLWLKHNQAFIKTLANGAAQQNLSKDVISKLCLAIPNAELIGCTPFEKMFDVITERTNENKCLSSLRDTLLPKLMSGEIRVSIETSGGDA